MTRFRKALLIGVALGLLGLGLRYTYLGLRLEEDFGLPFLFLARGHVAPPPDVVVVSIDKSSARQAGLDATEWPPPRRVHASVIRALTSRNVSAIVMDVLFDRHRSEVDDNDLAEAVARSGKVVLVQKLERSRVRGAGVDIEQLTSPIDGLQKSAIGLAPFPLPEGPLIHYYWSFFPKNAVEIPTLPAIALQVHALPILSRLVAVLEQSGGMNIDDLPRRVTTVADSQRLMDVLRRELRGNPKAVRRALSRLDATESGDASLANRRLLTSLLNLYSSGATHYLNFYGPAGTIKTIPFHELLRNDRADPLVLADKVVFVGEGASELVTTAQQADTYRTVYSTSDGVDLSGAEIGATALANLLTERVIYVAGPVGLSILLLVFGFSIAVLARTLPGFYAVVATASFGAAYFGLALFLFARHATLVPLTIPLLVQLPLAMFVGVFGRYRDIRKLVPAEIDPHGGLQLTYGVCLATDIRGYTALAASMDPLELGALMGDYFRLIGKVVTGRRGLEWGRAGDSSVSLWKAQVVRLDKLTWLGMKRRTDSDLRRDACLAAIELHDAVDRFNAQRPKTKQLQTRIGLDAGIVGFGPVAGELQTLGNAANTATRIEELKKLSTMPLASSDVVRDLEEFILRRLGFFPLSDKPGEVRIVEVFELRGVGTASELDQRLCEQFAAGLELYERQRWSDAARLFQGLAVAYPLDGPTAYYRDVCEDFLRSPRTAG